MQLDLFAATRAPMIRRPVAPHGQVERGKVDEELSLAQPRMAWAAARIELHRHCATGLWMWSTSFNTAMGGRSYRVGEKWGNFAATRDDALFYAITEMRERLGSRENDKDIRRILAWLDGLAPL